jgi:hypothetical protein
MNNLKTHLWSVGFFVLALVLVGTVAYSPKQVATTAVQAQSSGDELKGYAWSSNIGWLSFNCSDRGVCGTSDYKVTLQSDGTLTGYAWSPNIGWVRFGGLTDFPTGNGTTATNAVRDANSFKGFIRACSVFQSGCSGATKDVGSYELGGWDGWISLAGTTTDNSNYGATLSGNTFQGYAWGDEVVGWLNFGTGSGGGGGGVTVSFPNAPSVDLKVNGTDLPNAVNLGDTVNLSWTSNNATSCSALSGAWSLLGTRTLSGSEASSQITAQTTFTIQCVNSGGSAIDSVTVPVDNSGTLNVGCFVNPSSTSVGTQVTWTASVSGGTGNYTYSWSGDDGLSGSGASTTKNYSSAGSKQAYAVVTDENGAQGTCMGSINVKVKPSFQEF